MKNKFSLKPVALAALALASLLTASHAQATIGTVVPGGTSSPITVSMINMIGINEQITVTGNSGVAQGIKFLINAKELKQTSKVIIDGITWDLISNFTPDQISLVVTPDRNSLNVQNFSPIEINDKLSINGVDGAFETSVNLPNMP